MMQQPSGIQGFDRHEPKAVYIALAMVSTVILLVAVVFGLQFYYDKVKEQQVYEKVMEPEPQSLIDTRSREQRELYSYEYIDREKGLVRLPVERSMELLAAEFAAGKLRYPTKPVPVKKPETAAVAGPAAVPAAPGGGNVPAPK